MKTKEEKSRKISLKPHKTSFLKANWVTLVLLFLALLVIFSLSSFVLFPYMSKKSLEQDLAKHETTSLFSINKIVFYSSAYGTNNEETQARWNLNLSQYTDIAIYLNSQMNISSMYIDNISFSNKEIGNLSLSYLPADQFGKTSSIAEQLGGSKKDQNAHTSERIDLSLTNPITLRYLNSLKESYSITDIETPLSFDGSILKRAKVTISSLKNTVSFTLHVTNTEGKEYSYPVSFSIPLEDKENSKNIYDGNYSTEIPFKS